MNLPRLPIKLTTHKTQCPRCHGANGLADLCRIGRRLFLGWFNGLGQDDKMFTLMGMPTEMRSEVVAAADLDTEVSFGDKAQ